MTLTLFNICLVVAALAIGRASAGVASHPHSKTCRNIPGDARWPRPKEWNRLNATVDGRLIATVPIAHVCHDPAFSAEECARVQGQWNTANVMTTRPAEIMAPWFQNQSCVAFTDRSTPCDLGNYASYSINVSNADDIAAGFAFARKHNIRLVIKNSGHDFFGKSTGKGALSLWTRNLQHTEVIHRYNAPHYRGPAVKIGAGINGKEAAEFAAQHGYRFVVGSCPTVGAAGGFTQGGGHSFLSGLYGLGADNVLEWEVVTPKGKRLVATPTQNSELYWALSGGGGGTYGVVVSMTSRVFPDGDIALATLSFNTTTTGGDDPFWASVGVVLSQLQPLVDNHAAVAQISLTRTTFSIFGLMVPNTTTTSLATLLTPLLSALTLTTPSLTTTSLSLSLTHNTTYASLYAATVEPLTASIILPPVIGGRFISRQNWARNSTTILAALRQTTHSARFTIALTALNTHSTQRIAPPIAPNSATPHFASAYLSLIVTNVWNWHQPWSDAAALQREYHEVVRPLLEGVTPGAGVYGNEANWQQPGWQGEFYGGHYAALRRVKERVDPEGVLWGVTGVGSEGWGVDGEGRLCRGLGEGGC